MITTRRRRTLRVVAACTLAVLVRTAPAFADAAPVTPPPSPLQQWLANPSTRSSDAGRQKLIAGAVMATLGLAVGGVGAGLVVLAHSTVEPLNNPAPKASYDPSLVDRAGTIQTAAIACIGVGGAALVTGIVLGALGTVQRGERIALVPSVGAGGGGLAVVVGF